MACAVDLFCGIGGLTKGISLSGINVSLGIDNDPDCEFAYTRNNRANFLCADIDTVTGDQIMEFYPENETHILVGCAPCQPFSRYSIRYRKNGRRDEKWRLLYSFQRLAGEILPEIVSMENVPSLRNEKVFKDFTEALNREGYYISSQVVYCPDYGVPQSRSRLVLLASRLGPIDLIPPTYTRDQYKTVRSAISSLPPLKAGETDPSDPLHTACGLSEKNLKRIRESSPGGNWSEWDEDLQLNCHRKATGKTYRSVYGRMEWDKPSPTITTQFYGYGNGRFGHPEQDRAISLREGALLQSFPPDYIFFDRDHPLVRRELGMHIGNAVPVELGRAIGISIQRHLNQYGGN